MLELFYRVSFNPYRGPYAAIKQQALSWPGCRSEPLRYLMKPSPPNARPRACRIDLKSLEKRHFITHFCCQRLILHARA